MNKDFFKTKYSEDLTDEYRHLVQNDGYVYATFRPSNDRILLVLDDITNNKLNYAKHTGFRRYDGVDCINFLDNDIMTKYTYSLDEDIWYINTIFSNIKESYNMDRFHFEINDISNDTIISNLRKTFYYLQPTLQSHTLAGGGEANTSSDPNFYEGQYYLRDGELYTILKYGRLVEFYKGQKPYTYLFKKVEERTDCLYREDIDFDLYEKAIKLQNLKHKIIVATEEKLNYHYDEFIKNINQYNELKIELEKAKY